MKTIRVDNLTKRFGHLVAVDHISFEVQEGEVFGFLGANGAGKTSTIMMLATALNPTSGTATVCGYDTTAHGSGSTSLTCVMTPVRPRTCVGRSTTVLPPKICNGRA